MIEPIETAARFFQEGGAFMLPIALVLAAGFAIAVERYLFLLRTSWVNRRDLDAMLKLLSAGRMRELSTFAGGTGDPGSAVRLIFRAGLDRLPGTRRRQDVEYALEETLLEVIPPIEKRTPFLATFANIATLLGLLGTIIGLIAAFTAVADADPAEKARLLSSSISVAMNTTAFGLMVAIPLLLIHALLQGRTQTLVERLEVAVVKFLNQLEARHHWAPAARDAEAQPEPRTTAAGKAATDARAA